MNQHTNKEKMDKEIIKRWIDFFQKLDNLKFVYEEGAINDRNEITYWWLDVLHSKIEEAIELKDKEWRKKINKLPVGHTPRAVVKVGSVK